MDGTAPQGARLTADSLRARHRALSWVLWLHVALLAAWAVVDVSLGTLSDRSTHTMSMSGNAMTTGEAVVPVWVQLSVPLVPAAFGLLARWARLRPRPSSPASD